MSHAPADFGERIRAVRKGNPDMAVCPVDEPGTIEPARGRDAAPAVRDAHGLQGNSRGAVSESPPGLVTDTLEDVTVRGRRPELDPRDLNAFGLRSWSTRLEDARQACESARCKCKRQQAAAEDVRHRGEAEVGLRKRSRRSPGLFVD